MIDGDVGGDDKWRSGDSTECPLHRMINSITLALCHCCPISLDVAGYSRCRDGLVGGTWMWKLDLDDRRWKWIALHKMINSITSELRRRRT